MLTRCTKLTGVILLALTSFPAAETVAQKITPPAATTGDKTVALVGQKPQFKGGDKAMYEFIQANIQHPEPEKVATVFVTFSIEVDGSVQDVQVERRVKEAFDEEAIRVVKLMDKKWEPGTQDGKPVKIQQRLPIMFYSPIAAQAGNAGTEGEKPYTFVEKMPSFKGGEKQMFNYIAEHLKYPEAALKEGVQGQVFVSFVVGKDGSISNINILRGLGAGTDEEAIRIIESMEGKWEPGMQSGKAVPVRYNLPIKFSLSKSPAKVAATTMPAKPVEKLPVAADQIPAYKGGNVALHQQLAKQLELPEVINREHPYASLSVNFVVEKDGSLSNIRLAQTKVIKTISPGSEFDYMDGNKIGLLSKATLAQLAETATSALKSTSGNWEAGIRNGRKDRIEIEIPVTYLGTAKPVVGEIVVPGTKQQEPKLLKNDPTFTGDSKSMLRFISENIRYPEGAPDMGLVTVYFTVDKDKNISGFEILQNARGFDAEVRSIMELLIGSRFEDSSKFWMQRHTLTISFQTQNSKDAQTAIRPADIYVVKYK